MKRLISIFLVVNINNLKIANLLKVGNLNLNFFPGGSTLMFNIYLFEIGFGPLGTSCSLALKILFCHFNGGRGARELPLLGPFKRSCLVVCSGVMRFFELPSLAEAATMVFLFFAPSFMEADVDKLRSETAIAKWKAKSKENKRVIMEVVEGKAASPAMQNEVPSTNHPRSVNTAYKKDDKILVSWNTSKKKR